MLGPPGKRAARLAFFSCARAVLAQQERSLGILTKERDWEHPSTSISYSNGLSLALRRPTAARRLGFTCDENDLEGRTDLIPQELLYLQLKHFPAQFRLGRGLALARRPNGDNRRPDATNTGGAGQAIGDLTKACGSRKITATPVNLE